MSSQPFGPVTYRIIATTFEKAELTAAGTVPDSHWIPFSSPLWCGATSLSAKLIDAKLSAKCFVAKCAKYAVNQCLQQAIDREQCRLAKNPSVAAAWLHPTDAHRICTCVMLFPCRIYPFFMCLQPGKITIQVCLSPKISLRVIINEYSEALYSSLLGIVGEMQSS